MFSADLSWTEPDTEKVGERKERKAREKETRASLSSAAPSTRSSTSSKESIQGDRELWWTSGLRKAKAIKPALKLRPETSTEISRPRKVSITVPQRLESENSKFTRDPELQPGWTYSSSLSSKLPSGGPLDPPVYEVPELEGDLSSRGTVSSGSRSSQERQAAFRPFPHPYQGDLSEEVDTRASLALGLAKGSESGDSEPTQKTTPSLQARYRNLRPYTIRAEGLQDLSTLHKRPSYISGLSDPQLVSWRPPPEWNIVGDALGHEPEEKSLPPLPPSPEQTTTNSSVLELNRFQKFIRRMESAGPRIILDRLKEEWNNPVDDEACEELMLEKELWLLTALQLQNLSRYARFPRINTGKILELYGNLSEVYQLSAMHPRQNVHYLTTRSQQPIPLPSNVSYLTVPEAGALPLPYDDASFSHIRASTLPSLVPSSELPYVFRECHRLLAPGGMLEIRIMDAAPIRRTTGPKMKAWIEERVSENLERLFRCSKPCALVPSWLVGAGFDLPTVRSSKGEENVKLRCASGNDDSDIEGELSSLVGRALWRDIWGDFVDDVQDEARWWWEDDEVVQECLDRHTVFECGAIFAFKS